MGYVVTHTYAVLKVSPETYNEIRGRLAAAGYAGQFHDKADGEVIDMHGIALQSAHPEPAPGPILLPEPREPYPAAPDVKINTEAFLRD